LKNNLAESTFAILILDANNNKLGNFMLSNRFWIFSYQAEFFRFLLSIIILLFNSNVSIYTDLQAIIETFNNLYE
jgi:hypothetical protein